MHTSPQTKVLKEKTFLPTENRNDYDITSAVLYKN